jgi:hypothetical protein
MGLETTLIGYSPRRDQVIQYEVELKIAEQRIVEGGGIVSAGKGRTELANWVDYLFDELPAQPGRWSYKIDYTGRGGALNSYDVHYDLALEKFFGNLTILAPPLDVQ